MSHRSLLSGFCIVALSATASLVGCGDFSSDPEGGTAGTASGVAGSPSPGGGGGGSAAAGTPGAGSPGAGSPAAGGGMGGGSAAGTGGMATGGSSGSPGAGGKETPPEAACENVTACGGEVAGVWFATSACLPFEGPVDLTGAGIGCQAGTVTGKLTVSGNLTLGADKMFSDNTTTTGDIALELGAECLNISGTVTQCDRLKPALSSLAVPGFKCADSTTTAGGCTCKATVNQMGSMAFMTFEDAKSGMYTTADNTLKLASSVKELPYSYCVEGNFMKLTPTTVTTLGALKGTVVFQKQP